MSGVDYFLSLNVASSKDLVEKAREVFHRNGISTWMCTDISGGGQFRNEILSNAKNAKVFLMFINEKWAKSDECLFEFNYALRKNLTKKTPRLMPFVTENFDMEEYPHVEALMASVQGVFLDPNSSDDEGIQSVMEKLKDTVPINTEKPAQDTPKPEAAAAADTDESEKEFASVLKSLVDKNVGLPSGKWEGYFIDNRALDGKASGDKWLIDVNMHFQNNNQFVATGSDDVGPFTFTNGQIKDSKVKFLKSYVTHNVCYEGDLRGVQMTGRWYLETHPHIKGVWAMWPVN